MGVLDDLLGGLATQSMGGGAPRQQRPSTGAGGADMSGALAALVPVVLSMLSNRGAQGGVSQANLGGAGGGLGDVLGQVLGGAAGGRGQAGGLGGLLEQLQRSGFGEQAASWVSTGENKPISADAMAQVFGQDGIERISRQAGISREDAARGLSRLLPEVVDRVTPGGSVPDFSALTNSVDDLARKFGVR